MVKLFGFFAALPIVFVNDRGFSTQSLGLVYISLGLGFLTAGVVSLSYAYNSLPY